jgi:hypothetical protein
VLGKTFVAYSNTLGRTLEKLGIRPDRADKVPSLPEYLASKKNGTVANANGHSNGSSASTPTDATPEPVDAHSADSGAPDSHDTEAADA